VSEFNSNPVHRPWLARKSLTASILDRLQAPRSNALEANEAAGLALYRANARRQNCAITVAQDHGPRLLSAKLRNMGL
jgi:hypothetical protein